MSRPHITIAILTRNRPLRLRAALQSATGALDPPDDILVSDDSDDQVIPDNRRAVKYYPRSRYTRGPCRGIGANENHVVANLLPEAEWVVFIGDDAEVSPTFFRNLRAALLFYGPHRRIPTGIEIRNGVLIRPQQLDFLGFQKVPHRDYSAGSEVRAIVVQATAFPAAELRSVSWLEVSPYGYDEVDMTYKMQRLGWSFVFVPSISVDHHQADEGREEYPYSADLARVYFRLRSFSVYAFKPIALAVYLVAAPLHLLAARLRRRDWRGALSVPKLVCTAVTAWLRSLRRDWRRT